MPTFAQSLSDYKEDPLWWAKSHVLENARWWESAIKDACTKNRASRQIHGYLCQPLPDETAYIHENLRPALSLREDEKQSRRDPRSGGMVVKHYYLQDEAGRYFIFDGPFKSSPENVEFYRESLENIIKDLGFTDYKVTPVPFKDVTRTKTPGSLLSPLKVTERIDGASYVFYIVIRW